MCSSSSSKILSEVLVLPEPKPKPSKRKRKPALNNKARVITDTEVLEELKGVEKEKAEKEALKKARKLAREQKKKEKEEQKKEKELLTKTKLAQQEGKKGKKKARALAKKQPEILEKRFEVLSISKQLSTESEDEGDAQCPKCGLLYGEDDSMWVCCDGCSVWFNLDCTTIPSENGIPDQYFCEQCNEDS